MADMKAYTVAMKEFIRFWSKVVFSDGCWEWQGNLTKWGYGLAYFRGRSGGAHRVAWILLRGEIPPGTGYHGTCVLHHCDNRRCVRPDHLFLGTNKDNIQDAVRKGRHKFLPAISKAHALKRNQPNCFRGHPLNGDNLFVDRRGSRICRICKRVNYKRANHKRRGYGGIAPVRP